VIGGFQLVSSIRAHSPRPSCLHSEFCLPVGSELHGRRLNPDFLRRGGASFSLGGTMGAVWSDLGGAMALFGGRFRGALLTNNCSTPSATNALSRTYQNDHPHKQLFFSSDACSILHRRSPKQPSFPNRFCRAFPRFRPARTRFPPAIAPLSPRFSPESEHPITQKPPQHTKNAAPPAPSANFFTSIPNIAPNTLAPSLLHFRFSSCLIPSQQRPRSRCAVKRLRLK